MRYEANYIRNKVLEDGYFLYRNYYKEDEIINFRDELEYKIKNSPIYYSRSIINLLRIILSFDLMMMYKELLDIICIFITQVVGIKK